jgi:quercetin dioxygenase-like cupin family protein
VSSNWGKNRHRAPRRPRTVQTPALRSAGCLRKVISPSLNLSSSHPAIRLPSSFYLTLTFNPGPFGLLRGFLPTGMGRPAPALSAVSAMSAVAGGPYPNFPVRAYRRNRAVSQIIDSGLCHSCDHIAVGRIGTCQIKASRKSAQSHAPKGRVGQKYLASGIHISMPLWEREQPAEAKPQTARDYETVGIVLEGKAELHIEGQLVLLEKGDSWVVPKGSRHTTRLSKPLLQFRRPAHLRRCTGGTNNHLRCWNPLLSL